MALTTLAEPLPVEAQLKFHRHMALRHRASAKSSAFINTSPRNYPMRDVKHSPLECLLDK